MAAPELKYEQAYWEYIMGHPCHASLSKNAEQDAIAALNWYLQGIFSIHAGSSISIDRDN